MVSTVCFITVSSIVVVKFYHTGCTEKAFLQGNALKRLFSRRISVLYGWHCIYGHYWLFSSGIFAVKWLFSSWTCVRWHCEFVSGENALSHWLHKKGFSPDISYSEFPQPPTLLLFNYHYMVYIRSLFGFSMSCNVTHWEKSHHKKFTEVAFLQY